MKTYKAQKGPFAERPYYTFDEIDHICTDELQAVGLYPTSPGPVRIERFIEKRFGVSAVYEDLPSGIVGYTRFGPKGVEGISVSRALAEDLTRTSGYRVNTTLAHEAGHGLLHAHLFGPGLEPGSLFGEKGDVTKILCRESGVDGLSGRKRYDGRWWEFQANQAIGGLLLPRLVVVQCLGDLVESRGAFGTKVLPRSRREEAAHRLSGVFAVNAVVARIRLGDILQDEEEKQLTL